jgi:hypothetical protein
MALSRIDFWEEFFYQRRTSADPSVKSEAEEWYIAVNDTYDIVLKKISSRSRKSTRILHNGCGSSELGVMLASPSNQLGSGDSGFQQVGSL